MFKNFCLKPRKLHIIHNKGRLSAEDIKKKILDIAVEYQYDYDGDIVCIRKGRKKIKLYAVDVLGNNVWYLRTCTLKRNK